MRKLALSCLSLVLLASLCFGFVGSAIAETLADLSSFCYDGFVAQGSYVECADPVPFWDEVCQEFGGAPSVGLNGQTAFCDAIK